MFEICRHAEDLVTFSFFFFFFQSNGSIQFPNKNYIPSDMKRDETLRCEFTLREYTSLANCIIVIESY